MSSIPEIAISIDNMPWFPADFELITGNCGILSRVDDVPDTASRCKCMQNNALCQNEGDGSHKCENLSGGFIECTALDCSYEEDSQNKCRNRQFTRAKGLPAINVKVLHNTETGWGLHVDQDGVKEDDFIIEYTGEIIDSETLKDRKAKDKEEGNTCVYYMEIPNPLDKSQTLYIDARSKGNLGRCLNHSCEPNVELRGKQINGQVRCGFYALRDLVKEEELRFDYNWETSLVCKCNARSCTGQLNATAAESSHAPTSSSLTASSTCVDGGLHNARYISPIDAAYVELLRPFIGNCRNIQLGSPPEDEEITIESVEKLAVQDEKFDLLQMPRFEAALAVKTYQSKDARGKFPNKRQMEKAFNDQLHSWMFFRLNDLLSTNDKLPETIFHTGTALGAVKWGLVEANYTTSTKVSKAKCTMIHNMRSRTIRVFLQVLYEATVEKKIDKIQFRTIHAYFQSSKLVRTCYNSCLSKLTSKQKTILTVEVESRSSPSATSSFAREQQCSSHASEHQSAMDSVLDATATTTTTAPADGDESIKDGNDDKDNVDSVDDEEDKTMTTEEKQDRDLIRRFKYFSVSLKEHRIYKMSQSTDYILTYNAVKEAIKPLCTSSKHYKQSSRKLDNLIEIFQEGRYRDLNNTPAGLLETLLHKTHREFSSSQECKIDGKFSLMRLTKAEEVELEKHQNSVMDELGLEWVTDKTRNIMKSSCGENSKFIKTVRDAEPFFLEFIKTAENYVAPVRIYGHDVGDGRSGLLQNTLIAAKRILACMLIDEYSGELTEDHHIDDDSYFLGLHDNIGIDCSNYTTTACFAQTACNRKKDFENVNAIMIKRRFWDERRKCYTVRMFLVAIKHIEEGEPIIWFYGEKYFTHRPEYMSVADIMKCSFSATALTNRIRPPTGQIAKATRMLQAEVTQNDETALAFRFLARNYRSDAGAPLVRNVPPVAPLSSSGGLDHEIESLSPELKKFIDYMTKENLILKHALEEKDMEPREKVVGSKRRRDETTLECGGDNKKQRTARL